MKEKLLALAAQYDIPLTAAGAAALCGYLERLLETNRVMNLTAITDPDEALCKHLLDCLVAAALPEMTGRVADVGAGAGFPSVVIKALRPECEITALDATGKKLDFVASASAACGLACRTAHIRARTPDAIPASASGLTPLPPAPWRRCRCCASTACRWCAWAVISSP